MVRTLTKQDLTDFIYGAAIYGTGGGGSLKGALKALDGALSEGLNFKLVKASEIPDDAIVACPYGVGGGVKEELRKRFNSIPRLSRKNLISMGVEALERELDREIYAFIPGELGAGNAFSALYMAALTGKLAVDGDTVGRSVPEVGHSTYNLCDVQITPFVIVSPFGDIMVVTRVLNDSRAEDIDRYMAIASGGGVTVIDHPVDGGSLKGSIVHETVSKSIEVGRVIRESRDRDERSLEPLLKTTGGYLLFEGVIESMEREGREGFIWGKTKLNGTGNFSGHSLEVWFKNENLISWFDGAPYVSCPDLITLIDPNTAEAFSNWGDNLEGRRTAVIGIKAPDIWRTSRGLEILTPKYFGFDIEYTPIEKRVEGMR
ncbi:MAG: DUF917 domain-containing protein [Candidatus Bathyarchaeia archaeon]